MFAGVNAPSRIEADIEDLEVEGEIPQAIATLVKSSGLV
jgi:hypothetical protein